VPEIQALRIALSYQATMGQRPNQAWRPIGSVQVLAESQEIGNSPLHIRRDCNNSVASQN